MPPLWLLCRQLPAVGISKSVSKCHLFFEGEYSYSSSCSSEKNTSKVIALKQKSDQRWEYGNQTLIFRIQLPTSWSTTLTTGHGSRMRNNATFQSQGALHVWFGWLYDGFEKSLKMVRPLQQQSYRRGRHKPKHHCESIWCNSRKVSKRSS